MSEQNYPYEWEDLSDEEYATLKRNFGEKSGGRDLVRSSPHLINVRRSIMYNYMRVITMKIRPDDVWIVTHPKCGTTWIQEMAWNITTGVDLEAAEKPLFGRSPFIDMVMIRGMDKEEVDKYFDNLEKFPSPRVIKTHYPLEMLPPALLDTCKVIFVSRNVKDATVSRFHHFNLMKSQDLMCDFVTFAREIYMSGLCIHGGYFEMLESGWKRRDHPNLMFLWYEEMKEDQKKIIEKVCKFLNYNLSEEQIEKLNSFLQFDNFQKVSASNKRNPNWKEGNGQFIRKGIVGDWKNHFTQDLNTEYNSWIIKSLDKIGIQDPSVREYFQLIEKF